MLASSSPGPRYLPHWLHFPRLASGSRSTNSQSVSRSPRWLMHSRQITGWGDAPPGVAWASHVRAVLSEASCVTPRTSVSMTATTEETLVQRARPRRWPGRHLPCHLPSRPRASLASSALSPRGHTAQNLGIGSSTETQRLPPTTSYGAAEAAQQDASAAWFCYTATLEPVGGSQ